MSIKAHEFGVGGNPALRIIDAKGNIAMSIDGYEQGFTAKMKRLIKKLLKGMKT